MTAGHGNLSSQITELFFKPQSQIPNGVCFGRCRTTSPGRLLGGYGLGAFLNDSFKLRFRNSLLLGSQNEATMEMALAMAIASVITHTRRRYFIIVRE